jgi:hypothetical protein
MSIIIWPTGCGFRPPFGGAFGGDLGASSVERSCRRLTSKPRSPLWGNGVKKRKEKHGIVEPKKDEGYHEKKAKQAIQLSKQLIHDEAFKERHRKSKQNFSRERKLTFPIMMMILMQKGAKSMQLRLNEFFKKLKMPLVTSSAFSQARKQLKGEAFIELNRKAVVEVMYGDEAYQRYKGHRLLGVDGSKVYLPPTEAIIAKFGGTAKNQHSEHIEPFGLASVLYDLLNNIALDAVLAPGKSYEVDLAQGHLAHTQAGDVLIFDRNYPAYIWLATLVQQGVDFVGRGSRASFKAVQQMFAGQGADSQIVTIKANSSQRKQVRQLGLPEHITVRLVRLTLPSGETEILITSLLDEARYPTQEFGGLYFMRWGSETFYDLLKNRLLLENFTGQTVEAVEQDFHATIYISGLETLLTQEANETLQAKAHPNRYPQKVNQAVSFNTIKNHVTDLLFSQPDEDLLLAELTQLFLMKPTLIRDGRSVPRPKPSTARSLRFHKRFKKICF